VEGEKEKRRKGEKEKRRKGEKEKRRKGEKEKKRNDSPSTAFIPRMECLPKGQTQRKQAIG
jgi:hypothetical protein